MTGKLNPTESQDNKLHKRWFVDPLTLLLMGKLYEQINNTNIQRADPFRYLNALMKYLEISDDVKFRNLPDFLHVAKTRMGLYSKPYLVDFGAGSIKSASLPPKVWARMRTGQPIQIVKKEPAISAKYFTPKTSFKKPLNQLIKMKSNLWRKFYNSIYPQTSRQKEVKTTSSQSKKNIADFLGLHGSELSTLGWLLADWAKWLLTNRSGQRKGSKIRASSVYSYITSIAKSLHVHCGDDDLLKYSDLEFYALYKDVIDQKTSEKNKKYTAARLTDFHYFLVQYWDVENVDLSEFYRGSYTSDLGVDANLICPDMYHWIINTLGSLHPCTPREQMMLILMVVLAQKCGLRRGEVLTLLSSDILGNYSPVLFVRHNPYAYKKNDNAIRKIPLKSFLSHKELKYLKAWVELRKSEDQNLPVNTHTKNHLLFCKLGEPTQHPDESMLFKTIHKAMRQVTSDPNIHFHIFRHSFATWFLFRMESSADAFCRPKSICALNTPENSHRQSLIERARLHLDLKANRSSLYMLSQTCGHAEPSMSLRHYVHLLDLMLGLYCWRENSQPELTLQAIQNLTNIKKAMAYRYRNRSTCHKWIPSLFVPTSFMKLKHIFKDDLVKNETVMNVTQVVIEKTPIKWSTIQNIIEDMETIKLSANELEKKYGINAKVINNWREGVKHLSRMKTKKNKLYPNGKLRHRLASAKSRPIAANDIAMVDRILKHFNRMDECKIQEIQPHIEYLINHMTLKSCKMLFQKKSSAKKYKQFLLTIGIKPEEIKLIHYGKKGLSDADANTQLFKWSKSLSIPFNQCNISKKRFGQSINDGSVALYVNVITGKKTNGENKEPIYSTPYGFRYAIWMIFIQCFKRNIENDK